MTASDFAQLLHAKRVGRGRWQAKCPSHDDRTPSLSIAEGKRSPIVFRCMSQQCDQKAILDAMGLTWADILGPCPITPEIRRRLSDQARLKRLEGRWMTCSMNRVWDARNRNYWAKAAQKLDEEIAALAIRMDPSEDRERRMKAAIERYGWDAIWTRFLLTAKGRAIDEQFGLSQDSSDARTLRDRGYSGLRVANAVALAVDTQEQRKTILCWPDLVR
jgi:hypothetical protein